MIDVPKIKELIANNDSPGLAAYINVHKLSLVNNKITANADQLKYAIDYWDKKQLVKKINLNSLYGALLNPGCRFQDHRIGQSTTLTGRTIAKHMDAYINECITGKYDHLGDAIIYGDSVVGDTLIDLGNNERIKIEELFNRIQYKVIQDEGKEYAIPTDAESDLAVLGFNSEEDKAIYGAINYVMRHATKKQLYKVTMDDGTSVTVTKDHSLIVDRDGFLVEVKPTELLDNDLIISIDV